MKPQFVSRPAPAVSLANVKQACPTPAVPGRMQCQALVRTNVKGHAGVVPNVTPSGYGPSDLQSAYSLAAAAASAGTGETVAIVDAYDDPNAEADLGVYRTQYGLPACTVASSCLTIVNQSGGSALPATDPSGGWEEEESLDLDMVSAVCPNCKILLVEANAPDISDFAAAEDYAASHAKFVSNSWGSGGEFIGENYYDSAFNHPGVAITAAAGDSGYGAQYPAASQYVTSVGGTSLARDSAASRGWDESAWGGTGSGCSALEPAPVWQQINVSRTPGCENRTENDVAAVAG